MYARVYNSTAGSYRHLPLSVFNYSDYDQLLRNPHSFSALGNTYTSRSTNGIILIEGPNDSIPDMSGLASILSAAGFSDFTFTDDVIYPKDYTNNASYTMVSSPDSTTPHIDVNVTVSSPTSKSATITLVSTEISRGGTASYYGPVNNFAIAMFCVFQSGDNYYYGCVCTSRSQIFVVCNLQVTSSTFVEPSAGSGDKGFRPIEDISKHTIGGGDEGGITPGYPSDTLEQPGEPDESGASIRGTGFLNVYHISDANLAQVGSCLFGTTLMGFLSNVLISPIDYILSLIIMPYPPKEGGAEKVKIGRWKCDAALSDGLGFDASGNPLTNQFRTLDFGTLAVPEMWQSFLDYDCSSFSLYLPFIGEVDIPVNEVMGASINVQYTLDYFTGTCVANVLCTKNVTTAGGGTYPSYAQHSYQGNCAIQVPLASMSYGSMVGSLINAGAAGLKGNVAGVIGGILDAKSVVQTKGTISANAGFCAVMFPYITITRPITVVPLNYQEVTGYPSYIPSTLSECKGLCVCDDINLSGIEGATDSELERIKQLCKDGVII